VIAGAIRSALARIQELRRFLALSERKSKAVKQLLDSAINNNVQTPAEEWAADTASFTAGRTYDYVCSIVLLYGLLERFIEEVAEEYLIALIARTKTLSELPPKLQTSHFDSTIAQLQRTRDSRYNGKCDAVRLAESFSACISGKSPIDFINEPLLFHTSNFRVPVVDDFLNRIGIPHASRRAVETQGFAEFNNVQSEKRIVSPDFPESVWDLVNDLVERRNQVAHGDISAVLAPSALRPYCDLIEAYCSALAKVVRDTLAGTLAQSVGVLHDSPIDVFNHSIVCIQSRGEELHAGTMLACKAEGGAWYSLMVETVQIDGKPVQCSPKGQDVAVGLKTDGRCKTSHTVYSVS
jgi:hypothetical protein